MSDFRTLADAVIEEHRAVFDAVDSGEVNSFVEALAAAPSIKVFGMGRMKCSVRGFVMRLMHMGLDAHVVFDTTCPHVAPDDLMVINGACTSMGYEVARMAVKRGARLAVVTADAESRIAALADVIVRLKGQVHGGRACEIPSIQPMASLFEQTVFVFDDIVVQLLMKRLGVTPESMKKRHINVDGYMDFNEED